MASGIEKSDAKNQIGTGMKYSKKYIGILGINRNRMIWS
jgi:hypothetical protein